MRTILRWWMCMSIFTAGMLLANSARAAGDPPAGKAWGPTARDKIVNISGVYPHLAVFNGYGECGIGAVADWAGKLWLITYPPHCPEGGGDKLYTVDSDLHMEMRPESVGGTHANRMIHEESRQLIIGPYFLDERGGVRAADLKVLRARLTATMRHLTDPASKVFFLGMERELYEVDVRTLATKRIYGEGQGPFPGTHGKGGIVAQGRIIAANNGQREWRFDKDPAFNGPAGCLAESDGKDWSQPWRVVERSNFCEVSGPGGIKGFTPNDDRVWATGWDKRSVLLKLLEKGQWHTYRLPKASYSHDALHGWYTEWPRIREVTDGRLLMHMHGMFYDFPRTFSAEYAGGLAPISTHLKMPVDYCAWRGRIAMARDDASIMQNPLAGQSNSNLWFGTLSDLERYGAPAGFGGPWMDDAVRANEPSVPFLVKGFAQAALHLRHASAEAVTFALEADADGRGNWHRLADIVVPAGGYSWKVFTREMGASWWRIRADRDAAGVTAYLHLTNPPHAAQDEAFKGIARIDQPGPISDGIIKAADGDARTLLFAANMLDTAGVVKSKSFYAMDGRLQLKRADDAAREKVLREKYGVTKAGFAVDGASVIVVEGDKRYRLPKGHAAYDAPFASGWPRGLREVVTERNLFNAHGTFYEVPRPDAGGFSRMRPVCTHHRRISDFCSWRGLLVLAGVAAGAGENGHVLRSGSGEAALWLGEVDDLWRLGRLFGVGGPWKDTPVKAGVPSDAYLMFGYDCKSLTLSHDADRPVTFAVQVDFLADGTWSEYARLTVAPGEQLRHEFPAGYSAHWVRLVADTDASVSATFRYE